MLALLRRPAVLGVGLFLLAFLPRIVYVFAVLGYPGDRYGTEMERAAFNIVREGTLGNVYPAPTGPSAHVAPLYAYWLAFWFTIFGTQTFAGWCAQAVLAVTVTSVGIALLPTLARRLQLSESAGTVAAVLLALAPVNLEIECRGNWEQPYTALLLLALLFCFVRLHEKAWQPLALVLGVGLLVGLGVLLSPIILPAVAIMVVAELAHAAGRRWQMLGRVGMLAAVVMLCIAPWTLRNYRVLGGWVPVRSNFGLELACGNNPLANGKTNVTHDASPAVPKPAHPYTSPAALARLRELGELAYMKERQGEAIAWIAAHPTRFAELTLLRMQYYWFPSADIFPPGATRIDLKLAFFALTSLGCFGWLAYVFWRGWPYRWIVLALTLGPSISYLITHVDLRYRYPTFVLSAFFTCQLLASAVPGGWPIPWLSSWWQRSVLLHGRALPRARQLPPDPAS